MNQQFPAPAFAPAFPSADADATDTVVRLTDVHRRFGATKALDGISLSVRQGEVLGIIGRSGAGKSTLIRCLNGLERPDSGTVEIEGREITGLRERELQPLRRRVGMIFQHFNLLNAKTVAANIDWPLKITGKYTREQRAARVTELLELVGLSEQRDKYPAQLSGGQKQRVGIARALANYPHLLLCDEATSALDPETTQAILRLLLDINRKLGLTIVLITHEMQVIRSICDRVAVIDDSRIVESGKVADVFLHPKHAVTQKLVAESHAFEPQDGIGLDHIKGKLVRLTFVGDITYQPILTNITAATQALITILQGTISRIKDTPYGQLLVELNGSDDDLAKVFAHFDHYQIHHEVLA